MNLLEQLKKFRVEEDLLAKDWLRLYNNMQSTTLVEHKLTNIRSAISMNLLEQFRKLKNDFQTSHPDLDVHTVAFSDEGINYIDWFGQSKQISWGRVDKSPDFRTLAIERARLMYKVTEDPKAIAISDKEVELEFSNFRVIFTKDFLTQKAALSR